LLSGLPRLGQCRPWRSPYHNSKLACLQHGLQAGDTDIAPIAFLILGVTIFDLGQIWKIDDPDTPFVDYTTNSLTRLSLSAASARSSFEADIQSVISTI
jgi:hypothetical protein